MSVRIPYIALVAALWLAALVPAGYYYREQANEDRIVREYLAQNGLAGLPLSKESAVRISQQVRRDFETDERRFKALNMANRPFLREDTAFLLGHKEGLCGEGTRVLVNLLQQEGYDATRLTLYDRILDSAHTLVSVRLGGREFLLDSINSPETINAFLNSNDVSTNDFRLLRYSDDLSARRSFTSQRMDRPEHPFFSSFWLFSYEAVPYTKLLTKGGLGVRLFNFDRPPKPVSALAEKPSLIAAVAAFFAAVLLMSLLLATGILRRIHAGLNGIPARRAAFRPASLERENH
jgi:hypothetical protein